MSLIDEKLINAYSVMVMANKYILIEVDRINELQKLVPERFKSEVEILVAQKTIDGLI